MFKCCPHKLHKFELVMTCRISELGSCNKNSCVPIFMTGHSSSSSCLACTTHSQQLVEWLILSHVDCFSLCTEWLILSHVDCLSVCTEWLVLSHVYCFSLCTEWLILSHVDCFSLCTEWLILSHVDWFSYSQISGLQVVWDCLRPCNCRTSLWSLCDVCLTAQ